MSKKVLVTGGLGYIGSHVSYLLGQNAVIVDNESNSNLNYKLLLPKAKVYNKSINTLLLNEIFKKHQIDSVIHLAGLKSVNESINYPLKYYNENLNTSLQLLEAMDKFKINKLIFSSSATVYGDVHKSPLNEKNYLNPINPYGNTKVIIERFIDDFCKANSSFKAISLRYFNPIGANIVANLFDSPLGEPLNLIPIICKKIYNNECLTIYGNDYDTHDGTCLRDYIHVSDLAEAHIKSKDKIKDVIGHVKINVGLGKALSVLELIKIFQKVNNVKVNYVFGPRRSGDSKISFADNQFALEFLKWKPKKNYEQMCYDAWESFKLKND